MWAWGHDGYFAEGAGGTTWRGVPPGCSDEGSEEGVDNGEDPDGSDMEDSEAQGVDPGPTQEVASDDREQTTDHKEDHCQMEQ